MRAPLLRSALCAGLACVVASAGLASAAPPKGKPKAPRPKPVCNLITDPEGDVPLPSANLDIVSADIATNAKSLTGVIRVAKLANSDGTGPTGVAYNFRFNLMGNDTRFYLLASNVPSALGAMTFEYGTVNGAQLTRIGEGTGVLDLAKNEVRITAPTTIGDIARFKPGSKIVNLQAITQRRFVVLLSSADSTVIEENKSYTAGSPSCVTPGK